MLKTFEKKKKWAQDSSPWDCTVYEFMPVAVLIHSGYRDIAHSIRPGLSYLFQEIQAA